MDDFIACILARKGAGTAIPVSNCKICGAPAYSYIIDTLKQLGAKKIIFSVNNSEQPVDSSSFEDCGIHLADSKQSLKDYIKNLTDNSPSGTFLFITSDLPAVTGKTLKEAYEYHISRKNKITVVVSEEQERPEKEYSGIWFADTDELYSILHRSHTIDNLPEILAASDNTASFKVSDSSELIRARDSFTLNMAEQIILKRIIRDHMSNGVIFHLPETCYIHKDVKIGTSTVICPGTILEGNTVIGDSCEIGPYSRITDGIIGNNVKFMNSVMIQSQIGDNTTVGPFAYIRPGSVIGRNIKIGDFVEIKNSVIDDNTKVPHLSYVGDADVGKNVNFGCGSVVVNYDGRKKHRTKVGNHAFIGCNANLVSPVVINDYAYIAAGSTITEEVPEYALAIARSRQTNKEDWVKKKGLDKK